MDKNDLKIEYMRGTGPGGQHRNKTESACKITHIPTGISSYCQDERSQKANYRKALKSLEQKLKDAKAEQKAEQKKKRRDAAIKDTTIIRTYNYARGIVIDHRTKKTASIKDIMEKGRLDKLK